MERAQAKRLKPGMAVRIHGGNLGVIRRVGRNGIWVATERGPFWGDDLITRRYAARYLELPGTTKRRNQP